MTSLRRRHFLSIAALLFVLAGTFAVLRHQETTIVLRGESLTSPDLHDVEWNRATGAITRTGSDPYLWFDVPDSAIPLQRVAFEFHGSFRDTEGTFYLFQAPAHLTDVVLGEIITGEVTRSADAFSVSAPLPQSKVLRLDLPDFLLQPIELRQLILETSFVAPADLYFQLFTLFAVAAIVALVLPFLRHDVVRHPSVELALFAALIASKLVLSSDLELAFGGAYSHDDALFVRQAETIAAGQWLGPFNQLTLAKGPAFPLFLAAVAQSKIPLLFAQSTLHAIGCLAFVFALRPLLASPILRLLLFAVLLFDPHTLSASTTGRVLRSGVHPAFTLLLLAGAIGVAVHATRSLRALVGWSSLTGLAFVAFWYSREEGIWLLPSLTLLLAAAAISLWRSPVRPKTFRAALLILPVAFFFLATSALRSANARFYGAPVTVDVRDGAFPAAYGALLRIVPDEFIPGVPVTKAARLRAYAASPAFAQLQPALEGRVGYVWSQPGWEGIDHPSARKEILGGWFQWALRDAAASVGHYRDAATANAFWQRVADEINAACERGDLAAGPPRHGFFPPWHPSLDAPLRSSLLRATRVVTQMSDFTLLPPRNNGSEAEQAMFPPVTHERGLVNYPQPGHPSQLRLVLFHLYSAVGAPATLAALASLAFLVLCVVRHRASVLHLAVALALLGGACALIVIVSLVDVTSFDATHAGYLSPATPLALAAWILVPAWAWQSRRPSPPADRS